MNEEAKSFEVSVIVFREDSGWTALALEMNIRGYGQTEKGAIKDVMEMMLAQVSFAVQMGHPESVWHPAEAKYWQMFSEARRRRFVAELSGMALPTDPPFADMVPLPVPATSPSGGWIAAGA